MQVSPLISTTLAALFSHWKPPFISSSKRRHLAWTLGHSIVLYCLPPHSILCWWSLTTLLLRQWPLLIGSSPKNGPLGPEYAKVCEIVAISLLWKLQQVFNNPINNDATFPIIWINKSETNLWWGVGVVLLLSAAASLVLHVWSKFHTHSHVGVQRMVHDMSIGKSSLLQQYIHLIILACINATCEEVSSRGVWRSEYSEYTTTTNANLLQASMFGLWHYHGIPSGWTGVGLTFLYGIIMGLLQDTFGGALFLPILAHSLADFFIFSVIARNDKQQQQEKE